MTLLELRKLTEGGRERGRGREGKRERESLPVSVVAATRTHPARIHKWRDARAESSLTHSGARTPKRVRMTVLLRGRSLEPFRTLPCLTQMPHYRRRGERSQEQSSRTGLAKVAHSPLGFDFLSSSSESLSPSTGAECPNHKRTKLRHWAKHSVLAGCLAFSTGTCTCFIFLYTY